MQLLNDALLGALAFAVIAFVANSIYKTEAIQQRHLFMEDLSLFSKCQVYMVRAFAVAVVLAVGFLALSGLGQCVRSTFCERIF